VLLSVCCCSVLAAQTAALIQARCNACCCRTSWVTTCRRRGATSQLTASLTIRTRSMAQPCGCRVQLSEFLTQASWAARLRCLSQCTKASSFKPRQRDALTKVCSLCEVAASCPKPLHHVTWRSVCRACSTWQTCKDGPCDVTGCLLCLLSST
jgi:hypothetical protein